MRNVRVMCCMLYCGLLSFSSCTKDKGDTDTDMLIPKYGPGDTMELRGSISNGDMTALLYSLDEDISKSEFPSFTALGNGFGDKRGRYRSLMKFRIRHLDEPTAYNPPPVQKAVLYLYQYYACSDLNPYINELDTNNTAELHRVVGYWQDSAVTWKTQPALATGAANPLEDVVMIPAITTAARVAGTNDDQVIDVTDMVRKVFESRENRGFLLKLNNESINSGRSFGSFACPNINKRPKLVVYF